MKLLFDQNISFRLVNKIIKEFPGSKQVKELHLENATDFQIFNYAKTNKFTIVTFDSDFSDLSVLKGFPPKIIWIRTGNISTRNLELLLKDKSRILKQFSSENYACLEISE